MDQAIKEFVDQYTQDVVVPLILDSIKTAVTGYDKLIVRPLDEKIHDLELEVNVLKSELQRVGHEAHAARIEGPMRYGG
jgi:hypothetical protein